MDQPMQETSDAEDDGIDADDSDPEQEHDGGINSAHLSVH